MILPLPLATSGEVAGVLRPGVTIRADSALRTLRDNGLAGTQLSVVPRTATSAAGRAVWYSSLMLDVARLHRRRDAGAQRVLTKADELATNRAAKFLAEALAAAGPEPDLDELDAVTGGALSRLALLTESRREQLASLLHLRRSTGIVVGRADDLAIVETEDGTRLGVPAPPADQARLGSIGARVAVDAEQLNDRSSLLWVRPAFEPAADRNGRVPGPARLLSAAERERVASDVLVVG